MKRKFSLLICIALIFSMLAACGSNSASTNSNSSGTAKKSKKQLVIGFSMVTMESPFYVSLVDGAKKEASSKGVTIKVIDAQNDMEKQNSDIQTLLTQGINVLMVDPVNPSAIKPSLVAAKNANVPVISVDRNTKDKITSYIGRDNEKMGELAGKKAVELLGGPGKAKGTIIEIQGAAGDTVMQARHDGFHKYVDKEKGIKVVESPYCDYIRSKAVSAMQDLLQAHPDVNLVYAHNDDMALGAMQVLKQANKLQNVKIVSIDGLMEDVKQIKVGTEQATVINDPMSLGKLAVDTAIKVANGEKVDTYYDAGTGIIDSSNVDQYVDDSIKFAAQK
jgi:ribose transport system substrate-binding protein